MSQGCQGSIVFFFWGGGGGDNYYTLHILAYVENRKVHAELIILGEDLVVIFSVENHHFESNGPDQVVTEFETDMTQRRKPESELFGGGFFFPRAT